MCVVCVCCVCAVWVHVHVCVYVLVCMCMYVAMHGMYVCNSSENWLHLLNSPNFLPSKFLYDIVLVATV